MKILELLERLIQPEQSSKQYRGHFNDTPEYAHPDKILGGGLYSVARDDKTDPHMVKKSNYRPMGNIKYNGRAERDPFDAYIDYIIDNDLMDNIHFPRVYNVKRIKDQDGKQVSKYQMERLVPLTNLSFEEFSALIETHFKQRLALPFDGNTSKWDDYEYKIARDAIAQVLNAAAGGDGRALSTIKLYALEDAVNHINKLAKRTRATLDIHRENIMVRRTPHGPQLVITDPLS